MDGDLAVKIIMACGGVGTLVTGYLLSKRGQADTREQQAAAHTLQTRVNTVDELEAVILHLKEARDRAETERDRLAAQKDAESQLQAARCQVQINRLIDNVATLQSIVTDEIARASVLDSVRDAQTHQADDHSLNFDEPGGSLRY